MLFDVSKCKAMEFSRSGKNIYAQSELLMGDDESRSALAFVDTEKDMGVTFSRNLKFSIHIKNQGNRATGILGQLKRSFRYWTIDTCMTLYCAFVRPYLEYAAGLHQMYPTGKHIYQQDSQRVERPASYIHRYRLGQQVQGGYDAFRSSQQS
ncbi:RNA-directed DNA polymerase from mobile element jockey-like [Brachionus plicatilis]|uniref:RNA-directed DNA polymerase from mobile element jockey-like n=1 Tax=Brachionus plicatilis TaxID=10195 RepID=A0A3M7T1Z6_BRAPC|nr:RNA-directed DNA polymerase from mobile element jockey-like [Brachionus plicatilis]